MMTTQPFLRSYKKAKPVKKLIKDEKPKVEYSSRGTLKLNKPITTNASYKKKT